MAGIYIHIPYCKKACHYCNFHFSTNLSHRDSMVDALCKDIELRYKYLEEASLSTIYFGGGTPSLLIADDIQRIMETIGKYFLIDPDAEITLECNPDDIHTAYIHQLKKLGFNRFSIGIQSFFDDDLQLMNRAHNAAEAGNAILIVQDSGIENITIDLIYGLPSSDMDRWSSNVEKALTYNVPHISSYCLTIEEKTVFDKWSRDKKIILPEDSLANAQYFHLIDTLNAHGYDHYEISNFGKVGHYAIHNTNYWKGQPYLGIGPSAHSFNGRERAWCVSNNIKYIDAIASGKEYVESELLTVDDQYNEYVMIGLRTMWGIDYEEIKIKFGKEYSDYFSTVLSSSKYSDKLTVTPHQAGSNIKLNRAGLLYADRIASDFFK